MNASLNHFGYTKVSYADLRHAENSCAICREDYSATGDDCLLLACEHLFHTSCIMRTAHRGCPLCKRKIKMLPANLIIRQCNYAEQIKASVVKTMLVIARLFASLAILSVVYGTLNTFFPEKQKADQQYWNENSHKHYQITFNDCALLVLCSLAVTIGVTAISTYLKNKAIRNQEFAKYPNRIIYP